jgi:hypothetical protein
LHLPNSSRSTLSASSRTSSSSKILDPPTTFDSRSTKNNLGSRESTQVPSQDPPAHKYSPSLPSNFAHVAVSRPTLESSESNHSNMSTPRSSARKKQYHRPTTSDSLSPMEAIHLKRSASENNTGSQSFLPLQHRDGEALVHPGHLEMDPFWSKGGGSEQQLSAFTSHLSINDHDSKGMGSGTRVYTRNGSTSSASTNTRKGTVKAFLSGIKNNVVRL